MIASDRPVHQVLSDVVEQVVRLCDPKMGNGRPITETATAKVPTNLTQDMSLADAGDVAAISTPSAPQLVDPCTDEARLDRVRLAGRSVAGDPMMSRELDPAELVELVLADVFSEAMNWATAVYWLRRAGEARWALPRPGDYPGRLTPLERAEGTMKSLRRIYAYECAGLVVWAHTTPTASTLARLESFETFASHELRRLHDAHLGRWTPAEVEQLHRVGRLIGTRRDLALVS